MLIRAGWSRPRVGGVSSASPSQEPDPNRLRIGDAERNSALEALGEHMSSGRLSMDEYGERSAKVTQARTIADLRELFDDLPPPHPELPDLPTIRPRAANPQRRPETAPARSGESTTSQRVAGAVLAVSGILSVVLFFWTKTWVVFLLPALVAVISGAIWGSSQGRDNG